MPCTAGRFDGCLGGRAMGAEADAGASDVNCGGFAPPPAAAADAAAAAAVAGLELELEAADRAGG